MDTTLKIYVNLQEIENLKLYGQEMVEEDLMPGTNEDIRRIAWEMVAWEFNMILDRELQDNFFDSLMSTSKSYSYNYDDELYYRAVTLDIKGDKLHLKRILKAIDKMELYWKDNDKQILVDEKDVKCTVVFDYKTEMFIGDKEVAL